MKFKRVSLAFAAAASLITCSSAFAQELYFTEYQFNNPKIKAIGFDGSNLRELFTIPPSFWLPLGLAVNPANQRIYWSDSTFPSHDILAAGVNGSPAPASIINVAGNASRGSSLDAMGRIYFTVDNTIRRVNADGSGLATLITTPAAGTIGSPCVDATNGHVYFPYLHQIRRMDLDGTNVKTVVRGISNPRAIQIDIASNSIYWIDADTISDYVGRARLDDTEFTVIHDLSPSVVQSSGLIDLLLHAAGGKLYVGDELANTIYSMNLDGSGALPFYTSPAGLTPSGLALSTGAPAQPVMDCDGNTVPDAQQIASNPSLDCNNNGFLDACEADPCPDAALLHDGGSDAANSQGRALGWPSSWEQFQPFDVPAEGWTIGRIGLDGFTTNYHDGTGFSVTLWPDDGTGNAPDENGSPIAEIPVMNFRFDTDAANWVYADIDPVELPTGRFWLRLTANDPITYAATVNNGFNGLQSRFRGSSGILQIGSLPLAVRIYEGNECVADFDGDGDVAVPDIFAFLSAWFASDPSADLDGTPGIAVPDIFFFLSLWFAGC
jgi:hypothetical protein